MRRIGVVAIVCAISLVGYANAQSSATKVGPLPMTGPVADKAKAEIMQFEYEKVPLLLKGGDIFANFFDRVDTNDVVIIGGDGGLHSMPDHLALWRTGEMTQQNEIQWDHKIDIYNDGNVAIMTYLSVTDMTRDGKKQVHLGRIADVWVKQNGQWLRVVHAGAGAGR